MNFWTLIRHSLRFHWRAHLGVVLGAAVGSAALIGALVVGDSVRESLRERALDRLGLFVFALAPTDRFFLSNLLPDGPETASVLGLPGTAANRDGSARANQINVLGVDASFWKAQLPTTIFEIEPGKVILNDHLARKLDAHPGEEILIHVERPSAVSRENPMTRAGGLNSALRMTVQAVISTAQGGDFSLRASANPALNAFVDRDTLGKTVGLPTRANMMFAKGEWLNKGSLEYRLLQKLPPDYRLLAGDLLGLVLRSKTLQRPLLEALPVVGQQARLQQQLQERLSLGDLQASLKVEPEQHSIGLVSERVFLDPPLVKAATDRVVPDSPAWGKVGVLEARYGARNTNTIDPQPTKYAWGRVLRSPPATMLFALTNVQPQPILTYLATLLTEGTNSTPYSMVTAAGAPWTPTDMRDDQILVNQWLADDLHLKPGGEIAMSYFLPESGTKLTEATNTFRVRSIVPMEMPWADRTLMPDFPGIEKAESTSEWDAGFPLVYKVRPKDDVYWKQYRGTPKVFITLAAGQKMWGNRFGNLTAIRFPIPTNATTALTPALSPGERENYFPDSGETKPDSIPGGSIGSKTAQRLSPLPGGEGQGEGERQTNFVSHFRAVLEGKILANLKPEEVGLRFEPVREQALKAAAESQDFGGLFLGFSFFVIGAALLLMALLFSLGLEQRAPEIGTLLALGFSPKQVRSLLLREGVVLAFLGGVIGALGGLAYAKAMLHGLTTIWRAAVGASALSFHYTMQTLTLGLFASVVVSVITIWLTLRTFVQRPARELLVGEIGTTEPNVHRLKSRIIAAGALLAGVALAGWAVVKGDTANAGIFFGAGTLVLVAGLSFANTWLVRLGGAPVSDPARRRGELKRAGPETGAPLTLAALAVRGCARRRKRSLGTMAMLAGGSFLIVSIGVFRLDANRDATKRTSGTGGFALIGETTMPVVQDLNSKSGREFFALNEGELAGVNFVPLRVREGDEASCLNLNHAQKPRLLGVKPEMLEGRFAFAKGDGWAGLRADVGQASRLSPSKVGEKLETGAAPFLRDEVPAIGDANSIQWAMSKKVGDTIDYVDERGQPFKVRIVGAVANSILQGQLIIAEAEFVKRFPGESGYRMLLVDAPSNAVSQVSATLSRAMQDVGLELTPAAQRLAQFNAVQNTYLGTFQVLGGLGLLLGSVGLGIVVLRNVLERRGELAVLMAVGFRKRTLQRLLLIENGALLVVGLALGIIAAAVAVWPAMFSASAQLPYGSLALTLAAVLVNGALWTWAATRLALHGDLLAALRNE